MQGIPLFAVGNAGLQRSGRVQDGASEGASGHLPDYNNEARVFDFKCECLYNWKTEQLHSW
ncbi:hypothetical protein Dda_8418 [Drechslerella dactyloides]|uniref:Uncharacterized protein n=1 Tax=Drechslerella dactyloides TaxID=74499 RepID=A0AAD6NFN8_DREDA|nr:hypothetical protein Dda_8418 [Drechslerella dactyloides]